MIPDNGSIENMSECGTTARNEDEGSCPQKPYSYTPEQFENEFDELVKTGSIFNGLAERIGEYLAATMNSDPDVVHSRFDHHNLWSRKLSYLLGNRFLHRHTLVSAWNNYFKKYPAYERYVSFVIYKKGESLRRIEFDCNTIVVHVKD